MDRCVGRSSRLGDGDIARSVWTAACGFWARVAEDGRISEGFREIAGESLRAVQGLGPVLELLPTSA